MKKKYYATPYMVKQFHKQLISQHQHIPEFPESLMMMEQNGLLSSDPLPEPEISSNMSKEAFMNAYDNIPFSVERVTGILQAERKKSNTIPFPENFDLVCVQHFRTEGYSDQKIANAYALTYIFQGSSDIQLEDQAVQLTTGDVFIATPGFDYKIRSSAETFSFEVLIDSGTFEMQFSDFYTENTVLSDFLRESASKKRIGNYCVIHTGLDHEVRTHLQALAVECLKREFYGNCCALGHLKFLLASAFRRHPDEIVLYQYGTGRPGPDVENIIKYMKVNYRNISLNRVSRQFHYNSTYISRSLYSRYNQSFMDILTEIRISHAKNYLRKTNQRISEIAEAVGYLSAEHFSRIFKKTTGVSPSEYRKIKNNS